MSCQICERPGYRRICLDCRLELGEVPDYRAKLTETCQTCGGDISPAEKSQKYCVYCGERP